MSSPTPLACPGQSFAMPAVLAAEQRDVGRTMKELIRTNDPVLLSWVSALLDDQGIPSLIFDQHTSILEGSAGAIPRRLMVSDDDYQAARRLIEDSGAGHELRPVRP